MSLGEDLGILHVERHEVVHIEEPAVVDLTGGAPPVRQAVYLGLEQAVQSPLAALAGGEGSRRLGQRRRDVGRPQRQCAQAVAHRGRRFTPPRQRRGTPRVAAREPPERGDDLRQLGAGRVIMMERAVATRQRVGQHLRQGGGIERQVMLEVPDPGHAVGVLRWVIRRDAPTSGRRSPRIGSRTRRRSSRSVARQSMSNHAANAEAGPCISTSSHAGFWEDVAMWLGTMSSTIPMPCALSSACSASSSASVPRLGIETGRIHDIVPVRAALPRHEDRRAVEVADCQAAQVGAEVAGGRKRKSGVQLQPVRGTDRGHAITAAARSGAASANGPRP